MEKRNRLLAEELQSLLSSKKKRKRRKGAGQMQKDCANCHTSVTPEWRRGPSGSRDLCNSCGLRWAKQNGRVSPRTNSQQSESPAHSSPRPGEVLTKSAPPPSGSMPPPDRKASGEVTESARKAAAAAAHPQGQAREQARRRPSSNGVSSSSLPAKADANG
ncbi:MAG: blue light receptor [Thelocarpon impressellum]|nr:MAG: blue light receptor [Thelocarpon impressellum]